MRYIDTGSRDPDHALGTWLSEVLMGAVPVVAVRVQTGFFGGRDALGHLVPTLNELAESDGHTRFLIGSNDGETSRAAMEDLLTILGPARPGLGVGVVTFQTGFFHPKVFHFERADGTTTAYVGSANLTTSGVRSLHVEAGIILDTADGDDDGVTTEIAQAIDDWFIETRGGFYPVNDIADLDALVIAGVLGVLSPIRVARTVQPTAGEPAHLLSPLVDIPASRTAEQPGEPAGSAPAPRQAPSGTATPSAPRTLIHHWSKRLSPSDAQRKRQGNQRGGITLVQGDYRGQIDHKVYFRHTLFGPQRWTPGVAVGTGQPKEVARVPMHTVIDGTDYGVLTFVVSHGSNRPADQENYASELHLEPIAELFQTTNMTGKRLEITRYSDGTYDLTIS